MQTHASIRRMRRSDRRGPEGRAPGASCPSYRPSEPAGDHFDRREHEPSCSAAGGQHAGRELAAEEADELAVGADHLVALGLQVAALAVQAQHRHLQRDDADEHGRAGHDQQRRGDAHASRSPPDGTRAGGAARRGDGAHAVTSRCTTRRRAEAERGLAAISSAPGRTALLVTSRNSGVRPQPQTGRSGGQMQPRAA